MAINTANIDTGMDAYDSEGEKLGKVESIIRDPRAEPGLEQYRDAVNANVGTTSDADDADAEFGTSSAGQSAGSGLNTSALPFAGSTAQGGIAAAGAGAAPGSPAYGAVGALQGTGSVDGVASSGTTTGERQEGQADAQTGGYLHVKAGGLLGFGGKDLFVPTSAIQDIAPGDCVTLNVSKAEAEERYTNRPD